ncbi:mechanosensitive ion channel family protein [Aquimarina sediminis]|uniref:mechanosensitive ion channel family protein n=1 Tax=Aquimarina sediminis TaxID=2070536 RepID=UPI000CA02FEA|nr:mechanosensitive ion channel family protein [Aquimarina sediminis]
MKIIDFITKWSNNYIIIVVLVILVTMALIKVSIWVLNKYILHTSKKSQIAPTHYHFLKNAVAFLFWLIALVTITFLIPPLKAYALTVFASAGIFLAILGLAAQQALSNIVSGTFIVIFKPFRVGDFITIANQYTGTVEDITLRHTVIVNFENRRIIIPNSIISGETVINSSIANEKICQSIEIGISYESNIDTAKTIMREEAEKHPFCIDNRSKKEKNKDLEIVRVFLIGFGESSVNLKARVWCDNPYKAFDMHYDINQSIKKRFDKESIEIPYPHRTIVYKEPFKKGSDIMPSSL